MIQLIKEKLKSDYKQERTDLINLLKEFIDVFSWSYEDMPGINREIAQHTIPLIPGMKPVKKVASNET